jgi:D-alanine transfer protein
MYDKYLDKQIAMLYNSALGRTYGVNEINNGIKILSCSASKDDLIILGSSELDNADYIPWHPAHIFPNAQLNSDVSLVGRAGAQSLLNNIRIAALSENLKDKKIVFIVSLQWFINKEIDKNSYIAHFSELQFYKMMKNKNLSNNIKNYVCERTVGLVKNESVLERPYLYSYLYQKDNFISKIFLNILTPYYFVREKFLDLKDKHDAYKKIQEFKNEPMQKTKTINWNEEETKAYELGKKECSNNDFYVHDDYYTTYLEPRIKELKNSLGKVDLLSSEEFEDYEIFLKTCNELGLKPYIVFMPTNGFYYDYVGLDQEKRLTFYDKLGRLAGKYKIDYLDLRDKEYEPYFLKDVMHLGWKGWLYVNKQITKHYSNTE